jgi:hypothetical protein
MQVNPVEFFLAGALLLAIFRRRELVDELIEALNNFRGGPPSPMHPSPVNDRDLLRRRLR